MKVQSQNANHMGGATKVSRVDVHSLSVGMKIVGLDRPWGIDGAPACSFTILGKDELARLQATCDSVFVEVPAPSSPAIPTPEQSAEKADRPIVLWEQSGSDDKHANDAAPALKAIQRVLRFLHLKA